MTNLIELFQQEFFLRALLAGLMLGLIAAFYGCFIVWQKAAYFGDALSHSLILAVALAFAINFNVTLAVMLFSIIFAYLLQFFKRSNHLDTNIYISIIAAFSLSLGSIINSLSGAKPIDLHSFFFGDILSIISEDFIYIFILGIFTLLWFYNNWNSLLKIIINREIALIQKIPCHKLELQLFMMIALMIAISIKIVGVLLVTSMLVIPAASARMISISPNMMLTRSVIISLLSVTTGLFISAFINAAPGPVIVLTSVFVFGVCVSLSKFKKIP
jgi:zinc transport system permease protein